MKPVDHNFSRLPLGNYFGDPRRSGSNLIPRIKMANLGGRFESVVAMHDEVSKYANKILGYSLDFHFIACIGHINYS